MKLKKEKAIETESNIKGNPNFIDSFLKNEN